MVKPQQVDMHWHTYFSDGSDSPKKVVRDCQKAGKRIVTPTDHDTIEGIPEAIRAAKKYHIKILLPASSEFTTVYQGKTEHILGYCFKTEDEKLNRFFDSQKKAKRDYAEKAVDALTQFGFKISIEQISHLAQGVITDHHIYQAIIQDTGTGKKSKNLYILQRFNIRTSKDFNKIFLKGIIKFRKKKYSTQDVIKMIRDAGGYAVLAHAFWKRDTIQEIREKTEIFQKWGLNGIETFYSRHSQEQTLKLHQMAQELSTIENPVYETMGSDYHSSNRAGEFRKIGYIHTYGLKPNFFLPL